MRSETQIKDAYFGTPDSVVGEQVQAKLSPAGAPGSRSRFLQRPIAKRR
jgi:hypothetical protein